MSSAVDDRSYRALLRVPTIGRILVGMQIARIAQAMVGVAAVLFTLSVYQSAPLAGIVAFAASFPGLVASPIAGALLDRHGRTRLIVLDYLVAAASLLLVAGLSTAGALPAWLLVLIAGVSSLTGPLSTTGLRSLFPILVPRHLWERANAADSVGYVLAIVVGPPVAGLMVQTVGPQAALASIGAVFVVAAAILLRVPDPATEIVSTGNLLRDAWEGLRYTWRNPTLRGLGFSISTLNLVWGVLVIAIPIIVLDRLHEGAAVVGLVFAVQGLGGVVAALVAGRFDSRGRERAMLALPMLASSATLVLLLPSAGLLPIVVAMGVTGLLNGPVDIALFTIRQRRTDPAWMGRAFAVSMAFNALGGPVGSALAGTLANVSLELTVGFAILGGIVAAGLAYWLVPAREP